MFLQLNAKATAGEQNRTAYNLYTLTINSNKNVRKTFQTL